ncbi:peptidylprolyl isomerase [Zavarzinia sp.]|uniref:peptidylprolyl isomerase n=1 Tax=Zavarzinia sp. TaxID=2027920 RepID=UPI003562AA83
MRFPVLTLVHVLALAFAVVLPAGPGHAAATPSRPAPAPAPPPATDMGIAATVNETIITGYDVDQRVRLLLVTAGLPYSADTAKAARLTALRALVDEALQLQEAAKQDVSVSADDVEQSYQQVLQSNRVSAEQFADILGKGGVSVDALKRQLRAELAWNRVVLKRYSGRLSVGEDQVQAAIDRIKANAGRPESLVSEILIAVDNPEQEAQAGAIAQQLFEQIKAGARFSALAHQYSQAPSAANGGDIGWILPGQLSAELDQTLAQMQVNSVSPPIRATGGFYILGLRERRQTPPPPAEVVMVELKQVFVPANISAPDATIDALAAALTEAKGSIHSCGVPRDLLDSIPDATFGEVGRLNIKDLPVEYRNALDGVKIGEAGGPVRSTDGLHLLVLCDRDDQTPDSMMHDAVQRSLEDQQMSMLARRYLRDLRRTATIEVR